MKAPAFDRFWSKVSPEPTSGCLLWTADSHRFGHGRFWFEGKNVFAHRWAWEQKNGRIPSGVGHHGTCVLHKCDVPSCVNVDHLFLGTMTDNMLDRDAKGRQARGLRHGSVTHPEKVPRGRIPPHAILDRAKAEHIRVLLSVGVIKQHRIAALFGVGFRTISNIKHGKQWRAAMENS